jgi:hypothetical protein
LTQGLDPKGNRNEPAIGPAAQSIANPPERPQAPRRTDARLRRVRRSLVPVGAVQFELAGPDIKLNGIIAEEQVLSGFGCSGKNVSSVLSWRDAPEGTKSFALPVYHRAAPTGGAGWWR